MSEQNQIAARTINAAATFAATKDVRYYLNGVHFSTTDGALRLEATGGHTLLRYDVPGFTVEGAPIEGVYPVPKLPAAAHVSARVENGENEGPRTLILEADNGQAWRVQEIEGQFPDCSRVIPTPLDERCWMAPTSLNPLYLARAGKAAAEIGKAIGERTPTLRLESGAEHSHPVRFWSPRIPGLDMVVMPMRETEDQRKADDAADEERRRITIRPADEERATAA